MSLYFEIKFNNDKKLITDKDKQPLSWYFINGLLKSRIATDNGSNEDGFDEDVNVYIAGVLNKIFTQHINILKDIEVYNQLTKTDKRKDYTLCKNHADSLLMRCGVFPNFDSVPSEPNLKDNINRCSSWYYRAACLGSQLTVNKGLLDIFDKLYQNTETYVEVLNHVRVEVLNITQKISDSYISRLMRIAKLEHDLRD